jgi:hypothetical protein
MGANRRLAVCAALLLASATLVGCTGAPEPDPAPAVTASTAGPSSAPVENPADPELIAGGDAEANLPYFDFVNSKLLSGENPGGRGIIDNLTAAGFEKSAMQLTADRTPRGSDVDSLQFSVQLGGDCLIGQVDGAGYTSAVLPALESGSCLIGNTRAIDW